MEKGARSTRLLYTFDFQATAAHIANHDSVTNGFEVAYAVTVTYLPKD